eukprot:3414220-Prymnesium_polylepis.2
MNSSSGPKQQISTRCVPSDWNRPYTCPMQPAGSDSSIVRRSSRPFSQVMLTCWNCFVCGFTGANSPIGKASGVPTGLPLCTKLRTSCFGCPSMVPHGTDPPASMYHV